MMKRPRPPVKDRFAGHRIVVVGASPFQIKRWRTLLGSEILTASFSKQQVSSAEFVAAAAAATVVVVMEDCGIEGVRGDWLVDSMNEMQPIDNYVLRKKSPLRVRLGTFNILSNKVKIHTWAAVWDHRKEFLIDTFRELDLDVWCLQEASVNQLEFLERRLPTHGVVKGHAHNAVLYKKSMFRLVETGSEWLVESEGTDMQHMPRALTWALLACDERRLLVCSTHVGYKVDSPGDKDALSYLARRLAARHNAPLVLAGDFNARKTPNSGVDLYWRLTTDAYAEDSVDRALHAQTHVHDAWRLARTVHTNGNVGSTVHAFRSVHDNAAKRTLTTRPDDSHIDWILLCLPRKGTSVDVASAHVATETAVKALNVFHDNCPVKACPGGEGPWFPSDHHPVWADCTFYYDTEEASPS